MLNIRRLHMDQNFFESFSFMQSIFEVLLLYFHGKWVPWSNSPNPTLNTLSWQSERRCFRSVIVIKFHNQCMNQNECWQLVVAIVTNHLWREVSKNLLEKKSVKRKIGNCLGPCSNHRVNMAITRTVTAKATRRSALTAEVYSKMRFLYHRVPTPGFLAFPSLRSPSNKWNHR